MCGNAAGLRLLVVLDRRAGGVVDVEQYRGRFSFPDPRRRRGVGVRFGWPTVRWRTRSPPPVIDDYHDDIAGRDGTDADHHRSARDPAPTGTDGAPGNGAPADDLALHGGDDNLRGSHHDDHMATRNLDDNDAYDNHPSHHNYHIDQGGHPNHHHSTGGVDHLGADHHCSGGHGRRRSVRGTMAHPGRHRRCRRDRWLGFPRQETTAGCLVTDR